MDVSIVESRQPQLVLRIDQARVRARKFPELPGRSHGDDVIAGNGDGFGDRLALIHRVNFGIDDDQVSGERWFVGASGEVYGHEKNGDDRRSGYCVLHDDRFCRERGRLVRMACAARSFFLIKLFALSAQCGWDARAHSKSGA